MNAVAKPHRPGAAAMTTEDFITDLFCRVDDRMENVPNHP
jgi:hypothetical protein